VEAAQGFPVTKALAYLIETYPVVGDEFFHPYFRGRDKPIGRIFPAFTPLRGQVGGFKSLKAGFGNKVRGQEGGIHLKIVPAVKISPNFPKNPGPRYKQFKVHSG
jgi:hypothetical protein